MELWDLVLPCWVWSCCTLIVPSLLLLLSLEMGIFMDYHCIDQGYKLLFAEKELPYVLE